MNRASDVDIDFAGRIADVAARTERNSEDIADHGDILEAHAKDITELDKALGALSKVLERIESRVGNIGWALYALTAVVALKDHVKLDFASIINGLLKLLLG